MARGPGNPFVEPPAPEPATFFARQIRGAGWVIPVLAGLEWFAVKSVNSRAPTDFFGLLLIIAAAHSFPVSMVIRACELGRTGWFAALAIPILIAPALCGNEDGAYAAVGLIAVALVLATLFEWLHRSSAPRTSGDGVGILALGLAVVFAAGIYAMVNRYQFVTESQGERTRVRTLDRWTGKEVEVSSWRASGPPAPSVKWK